MPYSVVVSVTAPDMQMVVVPAMSTSATTAIAKVSFTALPSEESHTDTSDSDEATCGVRTGALDAVYGQTIMLLNAIAVRAA